MQTVRVAVGLRLGTPLCTPHTCCHYGSEVDALDGRILYIYIYIIICILYYVYVSLALVHVHPITGDQEDLTVIIII